MRIKNKYLRNCAFRSKHWKRIRSKNSPYKTTMPYSIGIVWSWSFEDQVKSHFEEITQQSRALENGSHRGLFHAPSNFKHALNKSKKAQVRVALQKINNGDYDDVIIPHFKHDADWLYF